MLPLNSVVDLLVTIVAHSEPLIDYTVQYNYVLE